MSAGPSMQDLAAVFDRANAMRRQGRWPEALAGYEAVLAQAPDHIPSLNNHGLVLARLGRHSEAVASYDAALAQAPSDPVALNNRGESLQKLMRPDEALASYDRAIAAAPAFAEAHGNRGYLLSQLGRTEEAIAALERAIALAPATPRFYHHLAPLRRFASGDPILARMQGLAAGPEALSPDGRIELGFALAKALADAGQSDRAFEELSRANRLKRSTIRYDEAAVLAELERIGELFGAPFQARMAGAGDPGPAPILIVGMPRSGSTLVEQILASHPAVGALGERSDLDEAVAQSLALAGVGPFPEGAAELSPDDVRALGADYLQRLVAAAPGGRRPVDKTLSNARYLGLVQAALPSARFIHMQRDPVDVCMSCYGRLFGGEVAFAYDLGELGRYHRALDRLMRRWREVLAPGVLLELSYEALIAEPETEVRRLFEHCGLDWHEGWRSFHRSGRQVRTSSASQVSRPLYADAIGASRAYGRHLAPLLEALMQGPEGASHEAEAVVREGDAAGSSTMPLNQLERSAASGDVRAQIALAEALDGEGRHTDAIEWLARAGQAGDAEALTRLGVRLLTGQDAPFMPNDGARLLSDAATAGGTEAMERLAVLIGGGFFARQSWPAALDLLQRAAGRGSALAQEQLRLLGGPAGFDPAAWTRAPQPRLLSSSPRIMAVERLLPAEICDWIIGQSAPRMVRAELYDPATGKPVLGTDTRLNRIANYNLADTHLLNVLVQARMAAAVGAPMSMLESFAVLHYVPGEEYGEHVDYLDPAIPGYAAELARMGQRVATCLIYLNDDFEGGETEFPQLGLSFKGRKGDALIFFSAHADGRPDTRTVHAGRTPTSGQKWLLSQFFRNRPVIGGGPRQA